MASLDTSPIPLEDHERWWQRKLVDPSAVVYIASLPDGSPAGYVRFALAGDEAEISVALAAPARGRGYGKAAIRLGCDALLGAGLARRVVALVKPGNEASLRAFRSAGFREQGRAAVADTDAIELVLEA